MKLVLVKVGPWGPLRAKGWGRACFRAHVSWDSRKRCQGCGGPGAELGVLASAPPVVHEAEREALAK